MSTPWDLMRERVPKLLYDRDEWTRRMMRWHFSPETGSPFWLRRAADLLFDPIHDILSYDALACFGAFDIAWLRAATARDLLPRGFTGRPFRVVETGGTTGAPCRVVDVTRADYDVQQYRVMLEVRGLDGGDVLAMTPSGPHAYGYFVSKLADSWAGATYFIDFDPRWVKNLVRHGQSTDGYIAHLVTQTATLLAAERPSLLFTTSKLLLTLATELPKPLEEYGVHAVCTGGTSCTAEETRYLRAEHLNGVRWIDTYGNTLMGHALQADGPVPSYHLPPPFGFVEVVDPANPDQPVGVGERGRVRVTTLLEDLFIPNLLERDSAVRTGPHPWLPWDGLRHVLPYVSQDSQDSTEGVY